MKHLTRLLAVAACLGTAAWAAPLQKTEVSADAKWLLHLDVDQLRSTPQGAYVVTNIADTLAAQLKAVMKADSGVDLDFTKVHSFTAYGDYRSNVTFLVKTDLDMEKIADGLLARIQHEGKTGASLVGKSTQDGVVTYSLLDHMVATIRPDGTAVLSKFEVNNANQVLAGKLPNLSSVTTFTEFPDTQKTFFFFGAAEGFNATSAFDNAARGNTNNPKAKILRMTDSGRIILGQDGDKVVLNVALKAKTTSVVAQMQQVIQGLVALASLAQPDDADLQQLTDSAKVTASGNIVNLSLDFPVDRVVAVLQEGLPEMISRTQHRAQRQQREQSRATNAPATTDGK